MKIALVGSAPSSRLLAPFDHPEWQIWACSPDNAGVLPRIDCWFELHADLDWPENRAWAHPYLDWLNQQAFKVYAQDQRFIPRALSFPRSEMIARYGCFFFTSSFSWMMALALSRGAKEIGLFGIDMATDLEYRLQRPHFQHFLHVAMQMGVKIIAPDESDILQPPPLYGYDMATPMGRKLAVRRREIEEKIEGMKRQRSEIDYHLAHLTGCVDDIDYMQTIWTGHRDAHADARSVEALRVPLSSTNHSVKSNGHIGESNG
jgi:hypothetical protein